MHTDLAITGKVAQFGRGVMADVSTKLMGQFADNLKEIVANEPAEPVVDITDAPSAATAEAPKTDTGPRRIDSPEADAVDLLDAAGAPIFKRLLPVAGAIAVLLVLRRLLRRRGD